MSEPENQNRANVDGSPNIRSTGKRGGLTLGGTCKKQESSSAGLAHCDLTDGHLDELEIDKMIVEFGRTEQSEHEFVLEVLGKLVLPNSYPAPVRMDGAFELNLSFPADMSDEEIKEFTLKLIDALDDAYQEDGGKGLTIDDISAREPAEVLL